MILKYWNTKFDIEWQLKYLSNNKLKKYPKSKENKNERKNIGYYSRNKKRHYIVKCQCHMSNLNLRVDEIN